MLMRNNFAILFMFVLNLSLLLCSRSTVNFIDKLNTCGSQEATHHIYTMQMATICVTVIFSNILLILM